MRVLDRILGWGLVLIGCVHNFVAAPSMFDELTMDALWFVSAGLALWYAGFINVSRAQGGTRLLRWFCVATNVTLLIFLAGYPSIRGSWTAPEVIALVGSVTLLALFSVIDLVRPRTSRGNPE